MADAKKWAQLRDLLEERCLVLAEQPIKLSTGGLSRYYFDCKAVTLDGRGLSLIADVFLDEIRGFPETPAAIGGLTMGADFITAAVAMKASDSGLATIHGSIVRKEAKKHGTMNKIENQLPAGTSIVVVDDVITTGNATRIACKEFQAHGYRIVGIIALVDREEGGRASLEKEFGAVSAIFRKSDFPKALRADEPVRSDQKSVAAAA